MGLKLTVSKGDKIQIGGSIVIDVLSPSNTKVQVEVHAPEHVPVHTKFADETKQFKNRKRAERQQDAALNKKC